MEHTIGSLTLTDQFIHEFGGNSTADLVISALKNMETKYGKRDDETSVWLKSGRTSLFYDELCDLILFSRYLNTEYLPENPFMYGCIRNLNLTFINESLLSFALYQANYVHLTTPAQKKAIDDLFHFLIKKIDERRHIIVSIGSDEYTSVLEIPRFLSQTKRQQICLALMMTLTDSLITDGSRITLLYKPSGVDEFHAYGFITKKRKVYRISEELLHDEFPEAIVGDAHLDYPLYQ